MFVKVGSDLYSYAQIIKHADTDTSCFLCLNQDYSKVNIV